MREKQCVAAMDLALPYAALGDYDTPFIWLDKALEERSEFLMLVVCDPRFDSLRSDPRFGDLHSAVQTQIQ